MLSTKLHIQSENLINDIFAGFPQGDEMNANEFTFYHLRLRNTKTTLAHKPILYHKLSHMTIVILEKIWISTWDMLMISYRFNRNLLILDQTKRNLSPKLNSRNLIVNESKTQNREEWGWRVGEWDRHWKQHQFKKGFMIGPINNVKSIYDLKDFHLNTI